MKRVDLGEREIQVSYAAFRSMKPPKLTWTNRYGFKTAVKRAVENPSRYLHTTSLLQIQSLVSIQAQIL